MQNVVPFRFTSTAPMKINIGVGDEDSRIQVYWATSSPLSDASMYGWFGRDDIRTNADATRLANLPPGDFEFMGVHGSGSPYFDVPTNTPFVTVWSSADGHGLIIVETNVHTHVDCPCGRTHRVSLR